MASHLLGKPPRGHRDGRVRPRLPGRFPSGHIQGLWRAAHWILKFQVTQDGEGPPRRKGVPQQVLLDLHQD